MRKSIKRRWVEDLRSGKYTQAKGMLHHPGVGRCCLGVLCEQAVEAGVVVRNDTGYGPAGGANINGVLPFDVAQWAGLDEVDPVVTDGDCLSTLNDEGLSFPQIASIIEEHIPEEDDDDG